jgi:hypothetical protein
MEKVAGPVGVGAELMTLALWDGDRRVTCSNFSIGFRLFKNGQGLVDSYAKNKDQN